LGHRKVRDARVTTHVCLAARAFGADAVWVDQKDAGLEAGVRSAVARFGGPFEVRTGVPWRQALRTFDGVKVHLTMYGEPVDEAAPRIRQSSRGRDLLVVVGASKVPGEVYGLVDFNVAVANQPHSEVAALAIALDRVSSGTWAQKKFKGASVVIRPHARGKDIVKVATAAAEEE
jgi:tRNA (cytidine56-2'-O)-methyltransferase